jgi:transposase
LRIWGVPECLGCKPMDERLKFIARLLEGERMAPLCREFGISRATGYKIFNRYRGVRPRRPHRPKPSALSARQQAALPGRALHSGHQA